MRRHRNDDERTMCDVCGTNISHSTKAAAVLRGPEVLWACSAEHRRVLAKAGQQ